MFLWRTEAGRVISVLPADLAQAYWTRIYGKVFQLKLQLNIGNSIKFDGFRESVCNILTRQLPRIISLLFTFFFIHNSLLNFLHTYFLTSLFL